MIRRNALKNGESINLNGRLRSPRAGQRCRRVNREEKELHFASEKGAHFLLFDLN